ncbi:hypothetical protein RFI_21490 [Reticulomyxa filosa]|uniref:Uncharacterized protein n=1 Tax=Reticulomyxa filosa TaxID=46433 RepID=X6MQH5_RETFI|nr:hypothetical protein RFI_21490 [Reticulomyxa filosa]|eukprot:ETO15871.1 hypothetical protein RFI_21490 [Reticulomyxa filosa]
MISTSRIGKFPRVKSANAINSIFPDMRPEESLAERGQKGVVNNNDAGNQANFKAQVGSGYVEKARESEQRQFPRHRTSVSNSSSSSQLLNRRTSREMEEALNKGDLKGITDAYLEQELTKIQTRLQQRQSATTIDQLNSRVFFFFF